MLLSLNTEIPTFRNSTCCPPSNASGCCEQKCSAGLATVLGSVRSSRLVCHTGGCDKQVKMWSLASNQTQVVAKHDAPIVFCFFVKEMSNMLVTASWDRSLKYWDLRQPNPVHSQQTPERVFAMDVKYPLMVVGTAQRRIQVQHFTHNLCYVVSKTLLTSVSISAWQNTSFFAFFESDHTRKLPLYIMQTNAQYL